MTLEPPHVGSVLGDRYELVRHIARGGMGDVYEGIDHLLERRVAVKVFRAASPADRGRFDSEVRVLASLNHPGLARVFDAGPHGDDAYLVLELVDGPPLSATLADGATLPPELVAEQGRQLADALAYIHEHGVVHRDVTPANVLCDGEGRPRLVDFGIVRLLDAPRVTSASIAVGTAAYMAPEQVQGHDVTALADVYSLGMVLLQALTGRREFTGTLQEMAMARLVRDPDTHTDVPAAWQPLLTAMCARRPEDRPTAAEVRDRLRALEDDDPTLALAPTGVVAAAAADGATSTMPVLRRPRERPPSRVIVLAGLAAALVLAVLLTAARADHPPTDAITTTTVAPPVEEPRSGGGGERPAATTAPPATEAPTTTVADPPPTTEAPATTAPVTTAPATTAPATTAPPATTP